jgi:hypothetical protein
MAMSRSDGSMSLTIRPPMVMRPADAVSSPAMVRSRVDFPQPDGPTRTQKEPSGISSETPRTASNPPG